MRNDNIPEEETTYMMNGNGVDSSKRGEHAQRGEQRRQDDVAHIVELQRQLKYASSVRANYEQQLHQLSQALQNERERKGEDSLKLHQLLEELQELRNYKNALEEQAEHWRVQAESALNPKASTGSTSGIPNEVLDDMKQLQQGEAYWRQQARALLQQYEQAEGDVQRMMRDLQYERDIIREKDETEHHLRQEVEYLQAVLHSNTISGENSRSHSQTWDTESLSKQPDNNVSDLTAGTPRLIAAFQEGKRRLTSSQRHGSETSSELDLSSLHPSYAKIAEQQMELLRQGRYEEAEQLSLNFGGAIDVAPTERSPPQQGGHEKTNGGWTTRVDTATSPILIEAATSPTISRSPAVSPQHATPAAPVHSTHISPRQAAPRTGIQQKTDMLLQQLYRDVDSHLERARDIGIRVSPGAAQLQRSIATDRSSLSVSASSHLSRRSPSIQIADLQEAHRFSEEPSHLAHSEHNPEPPRHGRQATDTEWESEETRRRVGMLRERLNTLPNSTPPPLRAKLALENRLAAGIQRTAPDYTLPWEMRVTIRDANNLPTKGRLGGGMFCCVSVLPADTNISSQRYDAIKHVLPDSTQSGTPGLVAQDRILRVMALEKTAIVDDDDNPTWNQTLVLRQQHWPIAGPRVGQQRTGSAQDLASTPCLLLVSVHCGSKKSTHQMGRSAILVQGKGTHQQSYTLLRGSGKPAMGASGQLSSVRIQYWYGPVQEASQEEERVAEPAKAPRTAEDPSKVSAVLGYVERGAEQRPLPEDRDGWASSRGRSSSSVRSRTQSPTPSAADTSKSGPRPPPRSSSRAHSSGEPADLAVRPPDAALNHGGRVINMHSETVDAVSTRRARSMDPTSADRLGSPPSPTALAPTLARKERKIVLVTRQGPKVDSQADAKVGIGISFGVTRGGHTYITGLSPNGPGRASGQVHEGDQLLSVDGVDIQGWKVTEIVKLILGKPGSQVRLEILAKAGDGPSPTSSPSRVVAHSSPTRVAVQHGSTAVSTRVVQRELSPDGTYQRRTPTGQTRRGVIA